MKKRATSARWTQQAMSFLHYIAGSVLYAVGVDMFISPNELVPGGVTGISLLINHVVPAFPVGIGIIVINLPLLLLAWRFLGRSFTLRTSFVTVFSSVTIDLLEPFLPHYTNNPLLAAIFGGVLSGVGLVLIFLRGATTGGSEIVARLLERRYPHISIGRLMLLVDGLVIGASALVFGRLEAAMYAAVLVFVSALVMDELIGGTRRTRTVLIITEKREELALSLTNKIQRGITVLDAAGAYTGDPRQVLMCAVRPSEVYPLRLLVREADPGAFIIVLNSEQVLGAGFQE
ncbi:MAG: YitT family protein [Clostridia bacterium]|nr:YitT family protein [Clostridia bacterium]